MKVLTAGGGSGGHVTPVRAVINELSAHTNNLEVRFVCDKRFLAQATDIMSHAKVPVEVHSIAAGKLRRYHGVSWARQLLDLPTTLRNIGDAFLIGIGTVQSVYMMLRWRPDVVFTKGGFVCLPIGFAAHLAKIPLVIHDSDAHPGLTNRILGRWASAIATGAPLENYRYPETISHYVGIPIDAAFHPFSEDERRAARHTVGMVDIQKPLVVVTGGGLGAKRINNTVTTIGMRLVEQGMSIFHISGAGQYEEVAKLAPETVEYILVPFVSKDMDKVLGAADVVVSRAGATTLLELAGLAVPTIIVPNPMLTGGHQTKNAAVYQNADAAIVLDENNPHFAEELLVAIEHLINNPKQATDMGKRMHQFARPDAALDVASLIVSAAVESDSNVPL